MPQPSPLDDFVAQAPIPRREIARFVREFAVGLPSGARVLDAGAGAAPYAELFAHCAYRTQDWPGSLHLQGRVPDLVGDLHGPLPVEAESFDAVLCTEVLEHVRDPAAVLRELHRILAPGGVLGITVPFVALLHEEPHDHQRLTNHGLVGLLCRAGFTNVCVLPAGGWFAMLASVLRDQGLATQATGEAPALRQRVVGYGFLLLSRLLTRFAQPLDDHLDRRRALPAGWLARATR